MSDRAHQRQLKRQLKRAALWLAGLVLAVWLLQRGLRGLDWATLWAHTADVPGWVWASAVLGILASHALRAARLHAEWQPRTGASFVDCLQLMLLHNAAVNLLPLRSGEAGYAWWLLRRWGVPLRTSLPSLLWLRLQDMLVLAALVGLALLPPAWALATVAALGVALATVLPRWWGALQRRLQTGLDARAAATARAAPRANSITGADANANANANADADALDAPAPEPFSARLARGLAEAALAGRGGARAWLCAVSNWCIRLVVVALLLCTLAPLSAPVALRGALAGEWAAVLPVQGPAGLGTYEAGVWLGTQSHGASAHTAPGAQLNDVVGAALVAHLLWLLVSLGAAVPAALRRQAQQHDPAPAPAPASSPAPAPPRRPT